MSAAAVEARAEEVPGDARGRPAAAPGEAAPGIERHDVEAVNAKANRSLYGVRQKIHAKRAYGTFRTVKWVVMAVTLGIYYGLPWLRWDRGEYLPDQAFLLDFAKLGFYRFLEHRAVHHRKHLETVGQPLHPHADG